MQTIEDLVEKGKKLSWGEQEEEFTTLLEGYNLVEAPKIEESLIAELHNRRGMARRMLENYNGSEADYQMALAITTDPKQRALARINLADVRLVGFKDFSLAHASLDEALTFIDNGTLIHAQAVDQRGLIFRAEENYETALACYRRAITICEELLNLDLKPELESSPKPLRSSSALEVMDRLVQVYQHRGGAAFDWYKENKEDSLLRLARESEEKVIELSIKYQLPDSTNSVVDADRTLGLISFESGDVQIALAYQLSAIEGAHMITGYQREEGILSLYAAECLFTLGRDKEGIPYLEIFRDRIIDGSIQKEDYSIIKPKVRNTLRLVQNAGSSLSGFEEITKRFR